MNREIFIRAVRIEDGRTAVPAPLRNGLRRADDFIRVAVLAGAGALKAGLAAEKDSSPMGIFLGTTTGPLETNFRFLDTLFDNGEGQGSPTLFTHSVHNSAAGYLSRLLAIQGPVLTVTTPGWPFLAALAEAKTALASLEIERALVLGVEEECAVLSDTRERSRIKEEIPVTFPCRLGAVAWLLTRGGAEDVAAPRLREIVFEETACDPAFYLHRREENISPLFKHDDGEMFPPSLAVPLSLSRAVRETCQPRAESFTWTVTAPCGCASVFFGS